MMTTTRPQVDPEGIYTKTQAAKALGVDRHTLSRYVSQGRLKCRVRRLDMRAVITGAEILRMWRSTII